MIEKLKEKNIKITTQRKVILEVIEFLQEEATLKNIEENCLKEMNASTVYRILEFFIKKEILIKNINYKGEIYYDIYEPHGHYFYCVECHKKEKIKDCPLEYETKKLTKEGNKILNHRIYLEGICATCESKK